MTISIKSNTDASFYYFLIPNDSAELTMDDINNENFTNKGIAFKEEFHLRPNELTKRNFTLPNFNKWRLQYFSYHLLNSSLASSLVSYTFQPSNNWAIPVIDVNIFYVLFLAFVLLFS